MMLLEVLSGTSGTTNGKEWSPEGPHLMFAPVRKIYFTPAAAATMKGRCMQIRIVRLPACSRLTDVNTLTSRPSSHPEDTTLVHLSQCPPYVFYSFLLIANSRISPPKRYALRSTRIHVGKPVRLFASASIPMQAR